MKELLYSFLDGLALAVGIAGLLALLTLTSRTLHAYFLRKTKVKLWTEAIKFRVWVIALGLTLGVGFIVSWFLTGRLLFGPLGLLFVPPLLRFLISRQDASWEKRLESESLSFFQGLLGLIQVGYSLPSALLALSQNPVGEMARTLVPYLNRFEEGQGFEEILRRFRVRAGLRRLGLYLSLLEISYRRGLSTRPLLERVLPFLETEIRSSKQLGQIRHTTGVNMALACLAPWFLVFALNFFQPELVSGFVGWGWGKVVLAMALVFEVLGAWVLWRVSCFY